MDDKKRTREVSLRRRNNLLSYILFGHPPEPTIQPNPSAWKFTCAIRFPRGPCQRRSKGNLHRRQLKRATYVELFRVHAKPQGRGRAIPATVWNIIKMVSALAASTVCTKITRRCGRRKNTITNKKPAALPSRVTVPYLRFKNSQTVHLDAATRVAIANVRGKRGKEQNVRRRNEEVGEQ